MSPKVIVVPLVAAGVALAMFKLVSLRRAPNASLSHAARPRVSAPHEALGRAEDRLTSAAGVLSQGPASTSVLPIAFWDAASEQLDADEVIREPRMTTVARETYDSIAPEDLGVEWLSRATEAFDVHTESDDESAEVQADSLSMIGEATRFAARSPSDEPASERLEELGVDSSTDEDGDPQRG
jgi:hypothetical protein